MIKKLFNMPANPWRDENEPTYLTVGDIVGALVFTLTITGTSYALIKYGDKVPDMLAPDTTTVGEQVLESGGFSVPLRPKFG